MSILIKGIDMPTKGNPITVLIYPDGTAEWEAQNKKGTAIPVPPHGDLIDRDALIKDGWLNLHKQVMRMGGYAIHELPLKNPSIPVIVPAEEAPAKDTNAPTTYDLLYEEGGYNSNGV